MASRSSPRSVVGGLLSMTCPRRLRLRPRLAPLAVVGTGRRMKAAVAPRRTVRTVHFTPTQYEETPLLAAPQSYLLPSAPLALASSQKLLASKSMHLQPSMLRSKPRL